MAARYWVGGSGSWNSTTKWSTTSGGASGASVPTAADNAIFDANSGTAHYTVIVTDNATCADLTFTPHASDGVTQFAVGVNFVIAGTFSTSGTQGNRRAWFRSSTYGLMRDMQIAAIGTVTDVDFRDIRVTGTAAPISGTRIGDLRGCRGITFSTPKTVYWNLAAGGNWSANAWAATSGGAVSTDNFPLAQDTAVIENTGLNTSATVTLNSAIGYAGSIDMSTRTNTMTISIASNQTIYGDWKNGSGTNITGAVTLTFSGRNTQTITSAGIPFPSGNPFVIDSYGGTVQLADALNIGVSNFTVTNGAFDTKNYNVTAGTLSSNNSNVRAITLGSSTVTLSSASAVAFTTSTNLTLSAGTSQITATATAPTFAGGTGLTFYNLTFSAIGVGSTATFTGSSTFNNVSVVSNASAGLVILTFQANQIITGTLTCAGASPVRRIFLRSNTLGTTRTLTVNSLSADDCDFRDITIAGAAAGASPTRAGDCGGNTGITFPAPKTVYWNLAGTQNWSATGWASSSGGTPDINNFPLAQDTAVFDNTGSVGTVTVNAAWNIGAFDASARTSGASLSFSIGPVIYSDFLMGTGVGYSSGPAVLTFAGRGVSTVTSNGLSLGHGITIDCGTGTVQLADALTLNSARTLALTGGTFDAVTYNVTAGLFTAGSATTLRMGSGTWTLSGTGTVWSVFLSSGLQFHKGTADIVLSDTGTSARTFSGGGTSYNKLTIGGATGTSTLTITGNNQFTELASTKTVAHTIALGTTTQTFGAWTVTGTAGNVVTLTGTGTSHVLAGACTSGIDYLAMGSIGFAATSPGEFYAGANSTGTAAAPVYRTAKPADSTRYWVGGTGNWSDTARWSTSSGGAGGASVPRSHDDVVFDSASNATAYTATVNAVTGGIRCKALTIAGPASGNLTLAGSTAIDGIHGDVTLPATGLTRTYTGAITLSGTGAGKTITTNGVALSSAVTVNGVGAEWALGSALNIGVSNLTVTNGSFLTGNYNTTCQQFNSNNANTRAVTFGSSTIDVGDTLSFTDPTNLTFSAGTSQVNLNGSNATLNSGGQTFYNVSYTTVNANTSVILTGSATFNNLTKAGLSASGITGFEIRANQTINGTFTISAGGNATQRNFVRSDTIGTTRTLTCAAVASLTDVDFRDIAIAGAAAPVSGTRLGDCKGNSGITFDAPKTVYFASATQTSWASGAWNITPSTVGASIVYFPLAQDTAIFPSSPAYPQSGNTVTINAAYNIGTIDMSARTSNTMTLSCSQFPTIYGNWINGTGTTLTGTGTLVFAGRGSQTITSAGVTFTQGVSINSPSGTVTLQDAFTCSSPTTAFLSGTFDANTFNVTLSSASSTVATSVTTTRTIAIGSGTWTIAGTTAWSASTSTNLTVTGTGTISLTSASAKTFAGGGISYSGITLDQGGAGTLTISGDNTFANISNSYSATGATTIAMGTTTQRVANFTASGEAGRVLTVQGTSASSPATLIFSGSGQATTPTTDYLAITGVRAYSLDTTWYAGDNSTNNGSLGWYFEAGGGGPILVYITENATGGSSESAGGTFNPAISELSTGSDVGASTTVFIGTLSEAVTVADAIAAARAFYAEVAEATTAAQIVSAARTLALAVISESAQGQEAVVAQALLNSLVAGSAATSDSVAGGLLFTGSVAEVASAAEAVLCQLSVLPSVVEQAGSQDASTVVASTFNTTLQETAQLAGPARSVYTGAASLAESAAMEESNRAVFVPSTNVVEVATTQEAFAALAVFRAPVFEVLGAQAQAAVAPSVFSAVALAVVEAAESFSPAGSVYNAVLPVQSAGVTDSLVGGYLWNLITTNQTPGWGGVQTPQAPGWSGIDDSQNPGWHNIDIT